ncbi:glucose-6-phosphate exchanger SLC37A4-like [Haliotis asinina]|uniref:glucose-6-phosphate exchanger SLC37A4-like n=1 Tax=Haliotis asinina TaxID=109174 RepID=UPI0035321D49
MVSYCQQMVMFSSLYVGYMLFVYVRKSFSFSTPAIMEEDVLEKSQLGLIVSSQMFGYMVSKFISGILVDFYSPTFLFAAGLFFTGVTAVTFTVFNSWMVFTVIWFLNGIVQGTGWPACAVLIKRWFSPDQFGTWWSILSTSMNAAGTVGPLVSAALVTSHGWRIGIIASGLVAMCFSGVCLLLLQDYPPGSEPKTKRDAPKLKDFSLAQQKSRLPALFRCPLYVMVCINYWIVSFIRGGCNDWGQLYLIEEKGQPSFIGSAFTSSQEVGGIVGSVLAGYISDYLVFKKGWQVNPRLKVVLWFTWMTAVCIYLLLYYVKADSPKFWVSALGFGIGFGLYGATAMFGVTSMETAPSRMEGTAHSIAALASNLGIVASGLPLSLIARFYNWHASFIVLGYLSMGSALLAYFSQWPFSPPSEQAEVDNAEEKKTN